MNTNEFMEWPAIQGKKTRRTNSWAKVVCDIIDDVHKQYGGDKNDLWKNFQHGVTPDQMQPTREFP